MTSALRDLPQPVVKGRACALGTLTSMQRRVEKLISDWETRAMTDVDRKDVARDAPTLRILRDDKWVYDDFAGVHFDLPEVGEGLTFLDAMAALEVAQTSAVSD